MTLPILHDEAPEAAPEVVAAPVPVAALDESLPLAGPMVFYTDEYGDEHPAVVFAIYDDATRDLQVLLNDEGLRGIRKAVPYSAERASSSWR